MSRVGPRWAAARMTRWRVASVAGGWRRLVADPHVVGAPAILAEVGDGAALEVFDAGAAVAQTLGAGAERAVQARASSRSRSDR